VQGRVEHAVLSEDLLEADRAHKRGQDHRHQQQPGQERLAGEPVAVRQPGQRQRDQQRQRGGSEPEQQAVQQAFRVHRVAKDPAQVL
jgi:hypothetical protein